MAVDRLSRRVGQLESQLYEPAALPQATAEVHEPDSEVADRVARLEEDLEFLQGIVDDYLDRQEPEAETVQEPEAVVAEPEPHPLRAEDMPNKASLEYCRAAWQEDWVDYCQMWGLDPETGR
jgi:hypothetical protein